MIENTGCKPLYLVSLVMSEESELRQMLIDQIARISRVPKLSTVGNSCSLDVSADGTLEFIIEDPEENGICEFVYRGVVRKIRFSSGVQPAKLAEFLTSHITEVEKLVLGIKVRWVDSNQVGHLSSSGEEAELILSTNSEIAVVSDYEPEDFYVSVLDIREEIIKASSEEEAIKLATNVLDEDGVARNIELFHGFQDFYVGWGAAERYAREAWLEARSENIYSM